MDNLMCIKLDKNLFSTSHDIKMLLTYVHPQGPPWYQQTGISCDGVNTDICLSNLIQSIMMFILCCVVHITATESEDATNI